MNKMPTEYEAGQIKKAVHEIKVEAGYYQERQPRKINPNEIAVRELIERYGSIIGIYRDHGRLNLQILRNTPQSPVEEMVICGYYTSTTVQRLGVYISDLVFRRSTQRKFQSKITPEAAQAAYATKLDLEQRLGP